MGLKRSQAPSVVYANKKPKLDGEEDDEHVPKKKKGGEEKRVNHLELYLPKKQQEKDENSPVENGQEEDFKPTGNTKRGKNVRLAKDSVPLFYLVQWRSAKKFDDKNGYGVLFLP